MLHRFFIGLALSVLVLSPALAQRAKSPAAAPATALKTVKDFKVELLYSVPKDKQGSWVSMCVDPKGRLIVSDQYGSLYRVTPPPIGGTAAAHEVEQIDLRIGEAQGLLWAFDSLYVVVNARRRSTRAACTASVDTNGDDARQGRAAAQIDGGGEHGPHAVVLTPDGKSLYVVGGNQTKLMPSPGRLARPAGTGARITSCRACPTAAASWPASSRRAAAIYNVDPDGKNWELVVDRLPQPVRRRLQPRRRAVHLRRRHGVGHEHARGIGPTRVCHVASGSEFGWRNGAGKWPAYYPDSLPAVVNIGPGSPTGVDFGYGAKFPAKYQDALFICDWSYGKLYAVHLKPHGSELQGRGRGVRHRHPAAADRRRRQPEGRRDVLRHRRPARRSRACTASPTSARNRPRPRKSAATPEPRTGHSGTSSKRSTARTTRRPSRPPGRTSATRTASSASPPAWRSEYPGPRRPGKTRPWRRTKPEAALDGAAGPGPRRRPATRSTGKKTPGPTTSSKDADPRRPRAGSTGTS